MTDGIGRIFNGADGGYGVNGFAFRKKEETAQEAQQQQPAVQPETKQVDPDRVMQLLAQANNAVVQPKQEFKMADLDSATIDRVRESMERFVSFVETAKAEFGSEEIALGVADVQSSLM